MKGPTKKTIKTSMRIAERAYSSISGFESHYDLNREIKVPEEELLILLEELYSTLKLSSYSARVLPSNC